MCVYECVDGVGVCKCGVLGASYSVCVWVCESVESICVTDRVCLSALAFVSLESLVGL